jgi:hypothetical protein
MCNCRGCCLPRGDDDDFMPFHARFRAILIEEIQAAQIK